MKFIVYYNVVFGGKVNRDYPDYPPTADVETLWKQAHAGVKRTYLVHEPHDEYVTAFAPMVGKDEDDQREWLKQRVVYLYAQKRAAQAAQASVIPANVAPVGQKPGDIVRDQHGRSGRVPHVPLEVFRSKPIKPDDAMDAVRDFCKGGGGSIPHGGH